MPLARTRDLLYHRSHYALPVGYALIVIAAFYPPATANPDVAAAIVTPVTVVLIIAAYLTLKHAAHADTCKRCAELRPVFAARIMSIEDKRKLWWAFWRSHYLWHVGLDLVVIGVPNLLYVLLVVQPTHMDTWTRTTLGIIGVGLWWATHFLIRHISYYSHVCPWCALRAEQRKNRRARRAAKKTDSPEADPSGTP